MPRLIKPTDETTKVGKERPDVKAMDEIAFHTSLLALNAAMEAARAGKGSADFAVIADDVRNQAIRVAAAAHERNEQEKGGN